jgi:hypothetical protein
LDFLIVKATASPSPNFLLRPSDTSTGHVTGLADLAKTPLREEQRDIHPNGKAEALVCPSTSASPIPLGTPNTPDWE